MTISGIRAMENLQVEDPRPVEITTDIASTGSYFQDQNPDRTSTPEFNQRLMQEKAKLADQERRLREMRKSEDLKELYKQLGGKTPTQIIDAYR